MSYMISCNMISYVTSYVTSCMISCMISYIWYHMPGASVLMYRTYDILIWYHNIWYHRCASFFWIYFWISMHKIYKMPLADARTRTLICTLKGSQSNHCTNGSLHYTIPLSLIIYSHSMKARHVGASSADPQCSQMPPSNMYHIEWSMVSYMISHSDIIYCKMWYHIKFYDVMYDITYH